MQADVERRLGIVDEVANDAVVLPKYAVAGDEPKNLIGEAGHGRKGLDFLIRQAWRLQHRALHDLVGVANQCASRFRLALHGELHPLRYRHFRQSLNQSLPSRDVRLHRRGGFGEGGFINWIARTVQFVELIFLLDGH